MKHKSKLAAADRMIGALVSTDDMRRRLNHATRLMLLNGYPEVAAELDLLRDLGEKRREEADRIKKENEDAQD